MVLSANVVTAIAENIHLTQSLQGAGVVQFEQVRFNDDQFDANAIINRTVADIVEQGVAVVDGVSLTVESNIEEVIGVDGLDGAAAILTDSGIVLIESPAVGIIAPADYGDFIDNLVANNEINNSHGIQNGNDEMEKLIDDFKNLSFVDDQIKVADVDYTGSDDGYHSNDQESYTDKETREEKENFVIKDIAGKGKGMFSTRRIFPGEIILREIPLITMNAGTFNDMDKCERYLDKVVDKMSMEERMRFLSCSYGGNENSYTGRFYTNDMEWDGDYCLCPTMARANHSCRPNADFYTCKEQDYNFLLAI